MEAQTPKQNRKRNRKVLKVFGLEPRICWYLCSGGRVKCRNQLKPQMRQQPGTDGKIKMRNYPGSEGKWKYRLAPSTPAISNQRWMSRQVSYCSPSVVMGKNTTEVLSQKRPRAAQNSRN